MATHSSILAWKIPWTEEPGRLQSMGSQESDTATKQQRKSSIFKKWGNHRIGKSKRSVTKALFIRLQQATQIPQKDTECLISPLRTRSGFPTIQPGFPLLDPVREAAVLCWKACIKSEGKSIWRKLCSHFSNVAPYPSLRQCCRLATLNNLASFHSIAFCKNCSSSIFYFFKFTKINPYSHLSKHYFYQGLQLKIY